VLDEIAAAGAGENAKPSIDEMRRLQLVEDRFSGEPQAVEAVRDVHLDNPSGTTFVRLYVPDSSPPHPAVLFLHGGGWALGSIERSDPLCRALCRASRMLIASVEYRLAPEHPFPAGLDDAYAALRWLSASGPEVGAIPGKLAVCGDSAGGNLAAAVSLMSRDRGAPEIALQVLIYPALDPALSEASMQTLSSGYGLTASDMQLFWELYLKNPEDAARPYASPLRETDLRDVAPALLITAEYDPLVDEGERYGALLRDAGVPARTVRYPGMIHGFMSYLGRVDAARAAVAECADALSHAMGTQLRSS
jgi:acetyl esterase